MDLGPLRALALEVNLQAHGVDITVTRPAPDNTPIEGIKGIWLTPITEELPDRMDFQRREPRRVMALRRTDVPAVPRGTLIVAPEKSGDDPRPWRVDSLDRSDADKTHVVVLPV